MELIQNGGEAMRWQCRVYDKNGKRCQNEALARIHFSSTHPFNHTDVCEIHLNEYKIFCWVQFDLQNYGVN